MDSVIDEGKAETKPVFLLILPIYAEKKETQPRWFKNVTSKENAENENRNLRKSRFCCRFLCA